MWQRIISIILKEFIQLRRDRRTMAMVIAIPIIQMSIFGYALSTDIKHVPLVVWDASNTMESRELIESFRQTEFFSVNFYATDYDDIAKRIESGDARVALVIPPEYSRHLHRGETAPVQFLTDGSHPTTGIQALANASLIVQAKGAELMSKAQLSEVALPISLEPRVWYNPAMQSSIFYLPGLVGLILQMLTVMLTSFAIVRERENGTIEQLNVTPLRRGELIVGKLIPYIIVAYFQVILVLTTAVLIFNMPIRGNLLLLLSLTSLFLMFSLGIGLFISTISHTQFQAMQASILILLPSIILSGFVFPVESMPKLAQWFAAILPLTYYLRIVRGIIVKGIGMEYLWQDTVILAAMGVITLAIATFRVRRTLT
ncbi:MAG: Transport permease protein [Dehalococcoidales bacterium]|nr:Transport permease protein [Dehalococcoidales bacterium]